jgi:hypothetical protein
MTTIVGQAGTANIVKNVPLFSRHRGTSAAELGKVYIRLHCTGMSSPVLNTDQIYVTYSVTSRSVGYADGAAWLNTATGATGTETYVYGTADNPVKTLAEAMTIAAAVGLKRIRVANQSSITLGQSVAGYSLVGKNWTLALDGQNIAGSYFEGAIISGVSSGTGASFVGCRVGTATIGQADFLETLFNGTFTTLTGGAYNFLHCTDGIPGTTNPVFVLTANVTLGIRNWRGGINFNAVASTNTVAIDGAGRIIIDSNCVQGALIVRGPFSVTDNVTSPGWVAGGGALTQSERLITPPTAAENADAVWDEATVGHVAAGSFGEWVGKKLMNLKQWFGKTNS